MTSSSTDLQAARCGQRTLPTLDRRIRASDRRRCDSPSRACEARHDRALRGGSAVVAQPRQDARRTHESLKGEKALSATRTQSYESVEWTFALGDENCHR